MFEYCLCNKCERLIMLDADEASGFCMYCGSQIKYSRAREAFLLGLKSSVPDELKLETELSELISEEDFADEDYYDKTDSENAECVYECEEAKKHMSKWEFAAAFEHYSRADKWLPNNFEICCGLLTSGILKLNDVKNWEQRLDAVLALIRAKNNWETVQKSLDYALGILKKFLSKGGRFVAPYYTYGFFKKVMESFPPLRRCACDIFAHCLNIDNAPLTDAARLDHETTRFAVGNYSSEPDKNLRFPLSLIIKYHYSQRVKEQLCRALYVYDRAVWLRNHDTARIDDIIGFMELICDGQYDNPDKKMSIAVGYDFLMMGTLEPASTEKEKRLFLSKVYTLKQLKSMERFFSGSIFFNRLYADVIRGSGPMGIISTDYKRIAEKIKRLTETGETEYYR